MRLNKDYVNYAKKKLALGGSLYGEDDNGNPLPATVQRPRLATPDVYSNFGRIAENASTVMPRPVSGTGLTKAPAIGGGSAIAGNMGAIAGVGTTVIDAVDQGNEFGRQSIAAQAGKGALAGAATGAALGTIVPGVGNLVGAAVGGWVGGLAGGAKGYFAKQKEDKYKVKIGMSKDQAQKLQSSARLMGDPTLVTGNETTGGYYADGGQMGDPAKPARATMSDSLAIYKNSKLVQAYYNRPAYHTQPGSEQSYKKDPRNVDELNKGAYDFEKEMYGAKIGTNTPQGMRVLPLDEYHKDVNQNVYYQREMANATVDTRAPMTMYDRRIKPQRMLTVQNEDHKDPMLYDVVNMPVYDPVAVKPVSMLTAAERRIREQKYGLPKLPQPKPKPVLAKSPAQPVVTQQPPVPQPVPQPVAPVPKQSPDGTPVFGPGNSMIGRMQGKDFYPDYNNTAARAGVNAGDSKIVGDSTLTSNYLKSKGLDANIKKYADGGQLQPMAKGAVDVVGPSHEQGGIQIGPNEVEGRETIDNGYVFSDKLGFADAHRPLAKAMGRIEEKPYNKATATSLNRMRDRVENMKLAQEFIKSLNNK